MSYELGGAGYAREYFARVVTHPDGVFELRAQSPVRGHHRPPVPERSRSRRSLGCHRFDREEHPRSKRRPAAGSPGPVPNGRRLMKLQSDAVRRVVVHHGVPRLLEVFPYRRRDVPDVTARAGTLARPARGIRARDADESLRIADAEASPPTKNVLDVSPCQPSTTAVTSTLTMSPEARIFDTLGTPWHTTSLTEMHDEWL